MHWRRHEDISLTWFLRAPFSAGSEWHFGCSLWVGCCAGYLLAGHCRLVFLSLLVKQSLSQGTRTSLHPSPGSSTSSSTTCLGSPSRSRLARVALLPSSNNLHHPTSHLSSIYHRYLYSPSVMTDSRHTAVSSLTVSLTTPSLFTSTIVHNIRTLNSQLRRIILNHAVQNNPSCCIQYISRR